jgi:hypothetical protein
MKCETARPALSARFDGEPTGVDDVALDTHVATCANCSAFADGMASLRQHLRFEGIPRSSVPDIAPAVAQAIASRPVATTRHARLQRVASRRWLAVAAAFVAGAFGGAVFVGVSGNRPDSAAFADLATEVSAAQHRIETLAADVHLVEHGLHPAVPVRTFSGTLRYHAPESLALTLTDKTVYPAPAWVPNDVKLVVDEDESWSRGPRACPSEALPDCTPAEPAVTAVTNREPFAPDRPAPLDLVTPVASFTLGGQPGSFGTRTIDGRTAAGIRTTAARVQPVLAGLAPAGNLRAVHPSDPVDIWLDQETLVPLALTVQAADDPDRAAWAANLGYRDAPGEVMLEMTLSDVEVNEGLPTGSFPSAPAGAAARDDGFVDGGAGLAAVPTPATLPDGFAPYRSGTVQVGSGPAVGVRSWTDGRAWLVVRASQVWAGGRLFGDLGPVVREVTLPDNRGVAYTSDDETVVAVHADGLDALVSGSVRARTLVAAAASLGVTGLPVPDDWAEAATATVADARAAAPGLLLPTGLADFGPPAVRVDGETVSLAYAGGGDRSFVLVRTGAGRLTPPLAEDVRGVRVRSTDGRYLPASGELEWVEDDHPYRLQSTTMSLGELLAVANGLAK